MDLTSYARDGFQSKPNAHLYSSPAYYAHALGAYHKTSGRTEPRDVRMSVGYTIRASDMRFRIVHAPKGQPRGVTFERIE